MPKIVQNEPTSEYRAVCRYRYDQVAQKALFVIDKKGIVRYIDIHDINKRPRLEVLVKELEKLDKYVPCAGKGGSVQIIFFGRIKMSKRKYMVRANRPALLRTARE